MGTLVEIRKLPVFVLFGPWEHRLKSANPPSAGWLAGWAGLGWAGLGWAGWLAGCTCLTLDSLNNNSWQPPIIWFPPQKFFCCILMFHQNNSVS